MCLACNIVGTQSLRALNIYWRTPRTVKKKTNLVSGKSEAKATGQETALSVGVVIVILMTFSSYSLAVECQ